MTESNELDLNAKIEIAKAAVPTLNLNQQSDSKAYPRIEVPFGSFIEGSLRTPDFNAPRYSSI